MYKQIKNTFLLNLSNLYTINKMKEFILQKPLTTVGIIVILGILLDAFLIPGIGELIGSSLFGLIGLALTINKNTFVKITGYVLVAIQLMAYGGMYLSA